MVEAEVDIITAVEVPAAAVIIQSPAAVDITIRAAARVGELTEEAVVRVVAVMAEAVAMAEAAAVLAVDMAAITEPGRKTIGLRSSFSKEGVR